LTRSTSFNNHTPCSKSLQSEFLRSRPSSKASGGIFDLAAKQARIDELNEQASSEDFWQNQEAAQAVLKERARLESTIESFTKLQKDMADYRDLLELAEEEADPALKDELEEQLIDLERRVEEIETTRLLGDPHDRLGAYVSFSPGAGGIDSADWTQMLLRMITRYADKKGFEVREVDLQELDEAGIKSATINVIGDYAYGMLKSERGIHRLVRISPFDAAARRHTSFAAIDVIPEIEEDLDIEVNEEDLRIDTYRAGGHGGQHVNKTDSAVRLTHLPSGIVVQCQNERSQHKNKAQAMRVLKARLYERELEKRRQEQKERNAEKKEIAWGSQIRSYVLAPYRLVKDTRTGVEVGNVDSVLDGDLDKFVRAYLLATAED
jgi:peptide chain release factor 2